MTSRKILVICLIFAAFSLDAQTKAPKNWFHLDPASDKFNGMSTDKLYQTLLKDKKSKTIVVAVLDSGVDAEHEDLKDIMWTNPGEIPGNGKDDDKNGYIDDVHGWNFIGGKTGNIHHESLELTRLYAKLKKKYEGKSEANADNKNEFRKYLEYKQIVESKSKEAKDNLEKYQKIKADMLDGVVKMGVLLDGKEITIENLNALSSDDKSVAMAKKMALNILAEGESIKSTDALKSDITEQLASPIEHFEAQVMYQYNTDFNDREKIVGDNPDNSYERFYGNNDVEGPDASHGTHVAGIIAAIRNNGIGMNGVADNVRIMSVRCVPDGDERDKDVANAIIYAVDNGASILNMSFGKSYSWDKEAVDKAVKYAADHDVLIVHAAGNDANNNDKDGNFPSKTYEKKRGLFKPSKATNWLEIGALSFKSGEDMPATFSNYGKKLVDVFSPGVEIYSTVPNNEYASFQGTSMASPACAGVAAILRSYYPDLSASQVRDIIRGSAVKSEQKVKLPGTARRKEGPQLVKFSDLSNTGGFVSSYEAAKLAAGTKGKGKSDSNWRKAAENLSAPSKPKP